MDIEPAVRVVRAIGHVMLENLYPRKTSCMFCGRYWHGGRLTAGLCPQCLLEWRRFRGQAKICPICGSFDSGEPCGGPCMGKPGAWPYRVGGLASIVAAAPYTGVYRQRIMAFKYNGQKQMAAPLAYLMAEAWRAGGFIGGRPCLVPVPMFHEKEAARGYNQSRLLAESLRRESGFPVAELLCRPVAGRVQAGLDSKQRRHALDQVIQWAGAGQPKPGPAIIVDDVVTTGATLESCAGILRLQGYKPIWGLAFAGGSGAKGDTVHRSL